MRRFLLGLFILATLIPFAPTADAARVRVRTRRGNVVRVRVNTHPGFPIRRTMPNVVVRGPVVRVAPRVYLSPIAFTAVAIASLPPARARAWESSETLDREEGWTDFSLDVDRRGTKLLLDIDGGSAQINFAEIVFDNGEAQVVDFNDRAHKRGTYELLDFRNGRKVDHVRMVAKANDEDVEIKVVLVQ
ncbi:MAG: hypothetical protein ACTHQM_26695 [Thermoanaerobaculia bacterium]